MPETNVSPAEFRTTTNGREQFPNIIQDIYGENARIVGFHRYGRALAALVSLDAIRLLGGHAIDPGTEAKIRKAAVALLSMQEKLGIR